MKQGIIFLGLFFISAWLNLAGGQDALPADSSFIEERRPVSSLSELKKEKDYQYGYEIINPVSSWWAGLKSTLAKIYDDFFNDANYGSYRKFFFFLALTLGLAYFILKLFGVSISSPFQRNDTSFDLNYHAEKETIHGRDFRKEIDDAVRRSDFKLAVRLYYLRTLKQLSEKNLIQWQPDKTNRSYYDELKPGFQNDFGKLTDAFEYCWYGNFEIRKDDFEEIKLKFENFNV